MVLCEEVRESDVSRPPAWYAYAAEVAGYHVVGREAAASLSYLPELDEPALFLVAAFRGGGMHVLLPQSPLTRSPTPTKPQGPEPLLGSCQAWSNYASPRSQAGSNAGSSLRPGHLAQMLQGCFDEQSNSVLSQVDTLGCSMAWAHRILAYMSQKDLVETQTASVMSWLASHEGAGRGKSFGKQMAMVEVRVGECCKPADEGCCCTDTCSQQQGGFREPSSRVERVLLMMRVHEE